jgi:hypothetical protein
VEHYRVKHLLLTLTDLVTGGQSITQGDKLFYDFTTTDFTAEDLASVSVEGITTVTGGKWSTVLDDFLSKYRRNLC